MTNYNYLHYFQVLAKHEHYRKASEELNITQPSLSNAIHNLESQLGVALFEKSGRGVRLTSHGIRYLEYVNNAFHELQTGEDLLRYEKAFTGAFLNLGIVLSVANREFPVWIREFQEYYGKPVFFSCRNGTSDVLIRSLKNGSLDLVVCSSLEDPRIEFQPILERQLVLLVPSSHRFASRSSVDIQELNGESFIAHSRGTALHDILAEIYRKNDILVKIVSEADEDRAIIGMVRAGLGCGVTTESPELFGTGFCSVPITESGFEGQICIGRKRNAPLSKTAEAFLHFVTHKQLY